MAPSTLRPLTVGEILSSAVSTVRPHWRALVVPLLAVLLPLAVLAAVVSASIDPGSYEHLLSENASERSGANARVIGDGLIVFGLVTAVFVTTFAASFKAIDDAWHGAPVQMGASLRYGLSRAPMAVALGVVWYAAFFAGWAFLIVPGLWFTVVSALSLPALMAERLGPGGALARSFVLLQGRFWATLALLVIAVVMTYLASVVIQIAVLGAAGLVAGDDDATGAVAEVLAYTASMAVTLPYLVAVLVVLYHDQRGRREGFATTDEPDAAVTARSEWASRSGWAAPSAEGVSEPAPRAPEAPPDDDRAAWLPPEAPR